MNSCCLVYLYSSLKEKLPLLVMSGIACFLVDLKGVLYEIESIIHFKKSTKSWPELKIYLIWSICIKN